MTATISRSFNGLPSVVPAYARALLGRKPYIAPPEVRIGSVHLEVRRVALGAAHLQRYRDICGTPVQPHLPPAYLHVVAMPLHMQLFIAKGFPVKVLGLIHIRNTIRVFDYIDHLAPLRLQVKFDTMRLTPAGQEYDYTTRYERDGQLVWEEVSTMFARGATPPKDGKRPVIERSAHPAGATHTQNLEIVGNTGWRYARNSGDFNPIHLTKRTAAMFGFKQAVAHGMWSMSRCLGAAATQLPTHPIQIDTQFKLPVYLPSTALVHTWSAETGANISMCTPRGDRLHLSMQVRSLGSAG
jgi:acyl dehydratase